MKKKVKCWERFGCKEKACPAYGSKDLRCWLTPGTHCRNEIKGKFIEKMQVCLECEVVKANMDATSMHETLRVVNAQFTELALGLSEVFEALEEISSGNPEVRIPETSKLELLAKLKHMVNLTAENQAEIVNLSHEFAIGLAEHFGVLHRVSIGDLTARVSGTSQVELLESLKKVTNQMIESVSTEITERKRAEETRGRTLDELRKANKELKEATVQLIQSEKLSALGELTAGVAHELNQPLNGIKIISQSILRDIEKNRFEEENIGPDLTEIVDQVNKMAGIIDHMRIFTRRSEGMHKEMIDINTVIEGPFKLLGQQLKTHNIQVIREPSPDLPKVMGDPIRLEQVFMNLIINAKNAADSCGKENKRIEIRTYQIDNRQDVAVEVKDNGGGIPEHLREKIFQPFFTTKEPGEGTGLGLSVSNKIIQEHKGRIEIESKVGEGTTFRVILPIAD